MARGYVSNRNMQRARRRRRTGIVKAVLALGVLAVTVFCGIFVVGLEHAEKERQRDLFGGVIWLDKSELWKAAEDTTPPVISGVKDITIPAGGSVSYKRGVSVSDDRDKDITFTVDNSQVKLYMVGDYPITYIAADKAGNTTEVTATLHVEEPTVNTATEELVNHMADELLEEITTDSMSQYEAAEAIFNWVHENVGYVDHSPKEDWIKGAYRGLKEHQGDCFVYAMTSKCLLTRAGIENMDIEKIPAKTSHYWNLINLGEGWYHFDNTRRKDGYSFFYCTDEEIMKYSRAHDGSHNYDSTQYPEIQ